MIIYTRVLLRLEWQGGRGGEERDGARAGGREGGREGGMEGGRILRKGGREEGREGNLTPCGTGHTCNVS